jgi:xylulokinase
VPDDGLTIGIDIGSSASKALVVDRDGTVVSSLRRKHRLEVTTPDRMEHDAAEAWRRAPRQMLEQVSAEARAEYGTGSIKGVCVAGMVPSLTAVDTRGVPFSPGLLYGDARGAAATPEHVGGGGAAGGASASSPNGAARAGGGVVIAGPTGRAPDLLRFTASVAPRAAGYWPAQAVANFAISGQPVVDTSTAIAMSPLYDGKSWSEESLREAGATFRHLPRVAQLGEPVGDWKGVPVASGIVDTLAEQLVAGADEDGDVLAICGTTLVVWCVTSAWREVPGLWTVPHIVPGKVLVGGASNAGGLFLEWARSITAPARGRAAEVTGHVPVWAPYPRGERTPLHDPDRRAMLADLQLSDGPGAVRRAAAEAAGFVVRQHIELAGVPAKRIIATGGGSKDADWMSALADTTGLSVDLVAVPEGAALGAAFVARMAAGLEPSLVDAGRWAGRSGRVEPGPLAEEAAGRYKTFLELSGSTLSGGS